MVDTAYEKVERVVYNDYEFPWGTTYRLFGSPVYDDANRSIRFWEWTLTADFMGEYDDLPADESPSGFREHTMYEIRHALTQPARTLKIKGLSFGDVVINAFLTSPGDAETGTRYIPDVAFGPKPSLFTLELKSGPYMSTVIWECKFYTHSCIDSDAPADLPVFLSYSTEVDFDVRDGLVRRMTIIEAHIPNRHHSEASYWRELISADEYVWVTTKLPIPQGFKRRVSRKLAKDGLSIQFRILDEEIPSNVAFEPYLTNVRAPFHVSSRLMGSGNNGLEPQAFSNWLCQLEFDCTVKKYEDKRYALQAFYKLMAVKYAATKVRALTKVLQLTDGTVAYDFIPGRPILLELDYDNDSYSLDFSARAVWIIRTTVTDYLEDTCLFEEPTAEWTAWLESMETAHRATGISNLAVSATDRPILDACNTEELGTIGPTVEPKVIIKPAMPTTRPCPPYQVLAFRPDYKVEEETNQIRHSPTVVASGETKQDGGQNSQTAQVTTTVQAPTIQVTGQSEYKLIFFGHVTTTGAAPSIPAVVTYQGANATRTGKPSITRTPINGVGDCVVWKTEWRIEYWLDQAPVEEGETKLTALRFDEGPEVPESGTGSGT